MTQSSHSKVHAHRTSNQLFIASYMKKWTKIIRYLRRACNVKDRAKQEKEKKYLNIQ